MHPSLLQALQHTTTLPDRPLPPQPRGSKVVGAANISHFPFPICIRRFVTCVLRVHQAPQGLNDRHYTHLDDSCPPLPYVD